MAPLGIITPLPWVIPIFQALPQPAGIDQWVEFSNKQILDRKKVDFLLLKTYIGALINLTVVYPRKTRHNELVNRS
jgi:hypothetical protein